MRSVVALVLGVSVVTFCGCDDLFREKPVEVIQPPSNVTIENYERISTGMSYDEVCSIMGGKGDELSNSTIGDVVTAAYTWRDRGGASISIVVQGGKVQMKSKFGVR